MLPYPDIDPVAIALGPIKIHWYGLTYIAGLAFAWWLARRRSQRPHSPLKPDQVDDLIFYAAVGVVLGGRMGYALFYGFERLGSDPLWLFRVWEGGMAFHGGLLGVSLLEEPLLPLRISLPVIFVLLHILHSILFHLCLALCHCYRSVTLEQSHETECKSRLCELNHFYYIFS